MTVGVFCLLRDHFESFHSDYGDSAAFSTFSRCIARIALRMTPPFWFLVVRYASQLCSVCSWLYIRLKRFVLARMSEHSSFQPALDLWDWIVTGTAASMAVEMAFTIS